MWIISPYISIPRCTLLFVLSLCSNISIGGHPAQENQRRRKKELKLCVWYYNGFICSCLFHPVLPKPQVSYKTTSPGVIEANCTSVSRPPAEIVWNVERDNRTMGPPVTTQLPQGDGTTLVISTLTVQSGLLKDVSVKCLVHHKGLESPIAVSMNTKSELVSVNVSLVRIFCSICFVFEFFSFKSLLKVLYLIITLDVFGNKKLAH